MIQLRHVPDSLHRKLKVRAATEGVSLSDYVLRHVKQAADQPTMAEILERISRQPRVKLRGSIVEEIRDLRGSLNGHDLKETPRKRS
jgi:antitoxin FitA